MPAWLHGLSVFWLAAFVFGVAFLVTAATYAVVISLSTGERGRAFASISPGLLPPMGIIFALLVGFLAAQVWSSGERAARAVSEEASALRSVVLLSSEFPGQPEAQMRSLVHRQIEDAVTKEWPQMGERGATLPVVRNRLLISNRWRSACAPTVPARQSPAGDRQSARASAGRPAPAHHREPVLRQRGQVGGRNLAGDPHPARDRVRT